ncbi:hypothetical protein PISMIDRAFT_18072 [Pisolithus microcarpus 441]|uniref:Uncharacterized protein n=1 Tax=Pisolithus microcarpus 441 TaxID=765257 RepID=A0A0C9XLR4_9AGAM|nr:hypothetical protein PISMIDRAFT_18072 [Pisolithus microcarpus 441]
MEDRGGQEQGQTLNAGDPILSITVSQDGRWVVSGDSGRNAATPEKVLDTKYQRRWSEMDILMIFIGRQHLEDIKESTDDELSSIEAANDSAEVDSLIGPEITSNRYHIPVARTHLTLNLGLYHPDIEDEVHAAFEELFNLMDNGAIDELLSFTIGTDAADSAEERSTSVNVRDINDIILQWLIDERQMSSTKQSTLRVLTINFASIQALYNLAAYPQHVGPLREEVDAIIQEHGWTKEAIALMRKAANFLVETRHLEGILIPSAQKKSNGGSNPVRWNLHTEGTHLSVPTCVFHCDSAVYDNPSVFNPFRFS